MFVVAFAMIVLLVHAYRDRKPLEQIITTAVFYIVFVYSFITVVVNPSDNDARRIFSFASRFVVNRSLWCGI